MTNREYRNDRRDKARSMVLGLVERFVQVIEESGATEEEVVAALKSTEAMVPFLELESTHGIRYVGGESKAGDEVLEDRRHD